MIAVLVNPGSTSNVSSETISELLRREGLAARIVTVERGADIRAMAARLLEEGHSTLVAAGGDGTVSAVASALAGTEATLGVLPVGGLNHFARDAGIPGGLADAARNLRTGTPRRVDVAEVNGRSFINNSGLGLYPSLVTEREKRRRLGWPKWLAFFRAAIATFRRFPFVRVRLSAGGEELRSRTPFVFVGNNVYRIEGRGLGSRDSLSGGMLFLGVARRPIGRWGLVQLAARALAGRIHDTGDVEFRQGHELFVMSPRRRLRVSLDGEVARLRTPLHYRIRPGALQVIAP